MQRLIDETDFDIACEIPELRKLPEKLRRFVWDWTHNGCNATLAAAQAGYSAQSAYAFLKRQDVIDAITALTDRMIHSAAVPAVVALTEIVNDPLHKDRLKAAVSILNRTGWPEVHEHRVKVERVPDETAMMNAAMEMAKKLGIDPAQLLGMNTPTLELMAIPEWKIPDPLPDGSDI